MNYSKKAMVETVLQQCGETAEKFYAAYEACAQREKEFYEVVGPGLKAAAVMAGISQADLAKATGLSKGTWINIFCGRFLPSRRQYIDAVRLLTGETSVGDSK